MPHDFNIQDFLNAIVTQDAEKLRTFFEPDADIVWSNTNEQFTVDEYIRANCEYPGTWQGEIESIDIIKNDGWGDQRVVFVARVWDDNGFVARTTSFIDFGDTEHELIQDLVEYWSVPSKPPQWRKDMKIGKRWITDAQGKFVGMENTGDVEV